MTSRFDMKKNALRYAISLLKSDGLSETHCAIAQNLVEFGSTDEARERLYEAVEKHKPGLLDRVKKLIEIC